MAVFSKAAVYWYASMRKSSALMPAHCWPTASAFFFQSVSSAESPCPCRIHDMVRNQASQCRSHTVVLLVAHL